MNCRKFESQMELFLAEKLPLDSLRECREHIKSCNACRELLDLAEREPIQTAPAETEEFVQAVLEKTSGKSCRRSHELSPDYIDGALPAALSELIKHHLEMCKDCNEEYEALMRILEAMPS